MKNVPLGVAAAYLGIPAELLALGMRSRMLPVGPGRAQRRAGRKALALPRDPAAARRLPA